MDTTKYEGDVQPSLDLCKYYLQNAFLGCYLPAVRLIKSVNRIDSFNRHCSMIAIINCFQLIVVFTPLTLLHTLLARETK